MSASSYRTLDGHLVRIEGPPPGGLELWSASIQCMTAEGRFGFESGPLNDLAGFEFVHPDFSFAESYRYQSGRLRIGSAIVNDDYGFEYYGSRDGDRIWLAYWEGRRLSLSFLARLPAVETPQLVSYFEHFAIAESAKGIMLHPRRGRRVEFFGSEVVREVTTLGLLTILDARTAASLVPAWPGTPVRGGRLFVSEEPEDASFFVLAGNSAITIIQPLGDSVLDDPRRMALLEELVVTWD